MSKLERTPITDATDQQLRDFCELQQLDVSDAKSRADLLGILGPVWEHDYITTVSTPEPAEDEAFATAQQTQAVEPVVTGARAGGIGANDPVVTVRIGHTPMPGGKDPVPLGHNGRTLVIQRNMNVALPYRFYLLLLDAIRQEVTQHEKTGELEVMDVTNYPMQVIGALPSDEEIAAWHERVDNELLPA